MGDCTETVVIEARSLMREALVSLMESHSYRVICSVGSIAEIDRSVVKDAQPELVILGALPADRVADITSSIRNRWQDAKIIMLFENASAKDLHKLMAAGLDACIPMFASPRTLIDTLQLIVCERLRVLMVGDATTPQALSETEEDEDEEVMPKEHPLVATLASSFEVPQPAMPCARNSLTKSDGSDGAARNGCGHGLSEREEQILKALVRGHSNKMIARMYSVTEATVKVHMKSILRKIRVANRTQAAIWAIKNARFPEDVNETDARTPLGL
jgi:two-component system nitrate/nitrite response regulator NarL